MIKLKGFVDYYLKIETNEVFSTKDGEKKKIKICSDSRVISWQLYRNGQRIRKTLWRIYVENWEEIQQHIWIKAGVGYSNDFLT